MQFTKIKLENCITVDSVYTIHYFEYTNNFYYAGESHDFWEFVYVDKGSVDICMDDKQITLKKGDIAFHQPNEFGHRNGARVYQLLWRIKHKLLHRS